MSSRVCAGWWDAGAGGKCWSGWEAPVSALEQDLSSQAPKEVVNEDGASEEGLRVVNESHLLQGKAKHMGTLLQNRCNLKDIILLEIQTQEVFIAQPKQRHLSKSGEFSSFLLRY